MVQHNKIYITKASGEEELFDKAKLENSLRNAGASDAIISDILDSVNYWIYPGISTKKLYYKAFSMLKADRKTKSVKYKLKQAFFELGSSGYPFENLIGELFRRREYECEVGVVVPGRCITHEMDVIATRDNEQLLMECKYRQDQGSRISIQVPLYVTARVEDIVAYRKSLPENSNMNYCAWVVTNSRFSEDSQKYANCSGMKLLGWDYPHGNGLKDLVERTKLYPISILVGLTKKEKEYLLNKRIVTCRQLHAQINVLEQFPKSSVKMKRLLHELDELLG